ncbi:succinate semialdehyde dehydrogenase [Atractiella rhizophila]|nr:succinate semialdehyde dehydrogenase [Atractiella rhizophila]
MIATKLTDQSLFKQAAYVNGGWITSSSSFPVFDPATSKEIGRAPELGVKETKEAIQHASEAFKTWSKTTAKQRADLIRKMYELMEGESVKNDLATICTAENGKTVTDSKGEVSYAASFFDWFAGEALRSYGETIPSSIPSQRNVVIKQPIGVCALICPWNFPLAMFARKLAPALAAGCTAVLKAPAETPFSALALAELAHRAGFPPGVINVLTADKNTKDIGRELCENPAVRKLSFTGSTPVGKLLMQQSSGTLKKLSFELGGNAPFIVFEDADLDEAVKGAIACKFRSSGQTCVCANRIYVHSSIYAEFASRFAQAVDKFKLGNGFEDGITHGPLIHSRALDKVKQHVEEAVAAGGQILIGGKPRTDLGENFFEPTVLSEAKKSRMTDEETFGPVAALYRFETEDEVIALANDTPVGLAGYFYSRDIGRIWRVAEALEVGMVGVNTGVISSAVIPFGGVKESGFGREGSSHGMDEYTVLKYIAMGGL